MTLGERLKFLRQGRGLKQEELAAFVGITQSSIANYETNFRKPPYDVLLKLADFYGVATDFLLRGTVPFSQDEGKADAREIPVVQLISVDDRDNKPVFKAVSHYEPAFLGPDEKTDYFYYPVKEGILYKNSFIQADKLLVKEQNNARDGDMVLAVRTGDDKVIIGKYYEKDDVVVIMELNPDARPHICMRNDLGKKLIIVGKVVSGSYRVEEGQQQKEIPQDETGFGEVG